MLNAMSCMLELVLVVVEIAENVFDDNLTSLDLFTELGSLVFALFQPSCQSIY